MSGAGGKADNDKTVAQAAGAVVASGVLWSLYKSIRGRGTTSAQEQSTQAKPSGSRPKADLSYQVVKGDTLWNISRRYGITVEDVREANAIPDIDYIVPGETLVIPH